VIIESTVELIIHEGKNRQIRKMCSAVNHEVITLKRISLGDLKLGQLKKGEYRNLTIEELNYISNL
jgi:23S rRNA pseudouridine2605 synthase